MADDHSRINLSAEQLATFEQCSQALTEHYTRLTALLESSFRREAKDETINVGGLMFMQRVPTGNISVCPHCAFMLVQQLRDAADTFEDVARRLELKEPDFAQWQRQRNK